MTSRQTEPNLIDSRRLFFFPLVPSWATDAGFGFNYFFRNAKTLLWVR